MEEGRRKRGWGEENGQEGKKRKKDSIILKMLSIRLLAPQETWFFIGSSNIPAEHGSEIVQSSLYDEDPGAGKGRWLAQCSRVVMSELGLEFRPPRSQCSPLPCHFRPPFLQAPRPSYAHTMYTWYSQRETLLPRKGVPRPWWSHPPPCSPPKHPQEEARSCRKKLP